MRILVTGGTTFVSRYTAQYFIELGHDVYVLNRNTKPQVKGVKLIEADRNAIGNALQGIYFDAVLDITAYDTQDITDLQNALHSFGTYIMISSSAVYPEYGKQPFSEDSEKAENKYWGKYGTDKILAENALLEKEPNAYILRPPYLYGPMNNLYREAFVFDCVLADRKFYLPKNGELKLQFFHVRDLCRMMEIIITQKPAEHIMNVGNETTISVKDWVTMCYSCLEKVPEFVSVNGNADQRQYFSFHNYEYCLDISRQKKLLSQTVPLRNGLMESFSWYISHQDEIKKKPYFSFIDTYLCKTPVVL